MAWYGSSYVENGIGRLACLTCEALFFGGGEHDAIADEARRGIVIRGVDAEGVHIARRLPGAVGLRDGRQVSIGVPSTS